MHIDIAATDVLAIPDQKYFGKQVSIYSPIPFFKSCPCEKNFYLAKFEWILYYR